MFVAVLTSIFYGTTKYFDKISEYHKSGAHQRPGAKLIAASPVDFIVIQSSLSHVSALDQNSNLNE